MIENEQETLNNELKDSTIIIIVSETGIIQEWNTVAETVLGYKRVRKIMSHLSNRAH